MGKSIEIREFWSESLVENFSQEQNNDIGNILISPNSV